MTGRVIAAVKIRRAERRDVRRIAHLHRTGLPDAFLSTLGERALRTLYRLMLADPDSRVLVAEGPEGVRGFIAGSLDPEMFVRSHRIAVGLAALPRIVRPSVLRRARETSRIDPHPELPPAEIMVIAVDPSHRRAGIGARLSRAALDELRRAGTREVKVSVAADNDGANVFYAALGFTLAATIDGRRGERTNVWVFWSWPSLQVRS